MNADEIEDSFRNRGYLPLHKFRLESDRRSLIQHLETKSRWFVGSKRQNDLKKIRFSKNKIYYRAEMNSYIAADIADFVRAQLLKNGRSFSFETVFSHPSKLEIMREAKNDGYRIYLYFLTTEDPEINVDRVNIRVAKDGHPVPREKII